jgi:hypothetical protein
VALALPALHALPAALGALVASVAAGDLTPDEGQAIAAVLETQRRAVETADIEQRLSALEARIDGTAPAPPPHSTWRR